MTIKDAKFELLQLATNLNIIPETDAGQAIRLAVEALEFTGTVLALNDCNSCKKECSHRPKLGDTVRMNCFDWEGQQDDNNN